jgi:hypothetical protein
MKRESGDGIILAGGIIQRTDVLNNSAAGRIDNVQLTGGPGSRRREQGCRIRPPGHRQKNQRRHEQVNEFHERSSRLAIAIMKDCLENERPQWVKWTSVSVTFVGVKRGRETGAGLFFDL